MACRRFIWSGSSPHQKLCMISWSDICKLKSAGGLGFKSLAMMSRALHMKLAWGLTYSPNSFWVQVLVSKYRVDIHNPPPLLLTCYGSYLWKSLGNVWSEVLVSNRWCLGDGQSVQFWWDLWVTKDVPLAAYATYIIPINILNGKVADFVKEDGSWYRDWFERFLPSNIIIHITALQPPSPAKGIDSIFWAPSKSGRFTTHSAYLAISDDNSMHNNRLWCMVWRWKGP